MGENRSEYMRKRNMKLFPFYKRWGWDYLFFYTINFLFLIQVKNISPVDVVLIDSFYFLFTTIMQIPATFIIEFLGRKNAIVFANILSCIYMVVIIFSKSLFDLIVAELISSLAFAIKESAEPSLLNESIPTTKNKSEIFAKINEKGMAGYYVIKGITTVLAGFLYEVNPYIPISLSLVILIIVTIISIFFVEPVKKEKTKIDFNQFADIKDSFKYILKSERIKSLILYSVIMTAMFGILDTYEISMLEELNISAKYLGILFAILGITSSIGAKKQEDFHRKHTNKSLIILGNVLFFSCFVAGIFGVVSKHYIVGITIIIVAYIAKYVCCGIYNALIEKYLSNFTNEEIDTKIFIANNCIKGICSAIAGVMASFLLDRMETAYCMIIVSVVFEILIILVSRYMKTRVGLKPENYSKEEIKFDNLKEMYE